jgi:isopentenyl phosphate kinase
MSATTPGSSIVVKLGGSVITRKRESERSRPKVIERLGRELADPPISGLIVLHGAGSFGHPGARRFGLAKPPKPGDRPEIRLRGGAIVAREVRRLHGEILRALIEGGAPAYSLPANTLARNRAGKLATFDPEPFRRALASGWVPVSFGDVVADEEWGVSILSADTVALELGRQLAPRRVVFVSDVSGVLQVSAGNRREPIPRLTPEFVEGLEARPGAPDVTGGIRAKATVMLELARAGTPAGLVTGLRSGAAGEALRSPAYPHGTWALP